MDIAHATCVPGKNIRNPFVLTAQHFPRWSKACIEVVSEVDGDCVEDFGWSRLGIAPELRYVVEDRDCRRYKLELLSLER